MECWGLVVGVPVLEQGLFEELKIEWAVSRESLSKVPSVQGLVDFVAVREGQQVFEVPV